jgi:ribosomal protein S18 acetylase RimI-like enzyme
VDRDQHSVVVRELRPSDAESLGEFFERLAADPASSHFHPHPLTSEHARGLAGGVERKDVYLVAVQSERVVGYSMLRGWDEGYDIPAFGVAVDCEARGRGVGSMLLDAAIQAARDRGASRVMLKVYPENAGAKRLYDSRGFQFEARTPDGLQLVGYLDL